MLSGGTSKKAYKMPAQDVILDSMATNDLVSEF